MDFNTKVAAHWSPRFTLDIEFAPEEIPAQAIMQYGVISVHPTDPVSRAATLLIEKNISGVPVVEDSKVVGMLSDKDLLWILREKEYLPGLVQDCMTPDAYSFDVDDSLADVCTYLCDRPFRRVPILHQERLAGIITRGDLLQVYKEHFRQPQDRRRDTTPRTLNAGRIMQRGLLTVGTDTPLFEAMSIIAGHHITGLPVVTGDMTLQGIVTEKDLLEYAGQTRVNSPTVETCTTYEVFTLTPSAEFDTICQALIEHDFHRIPIVEDQRLVGIISRSDVLKNRLAVFRA